MSKSQSAQQLILVLFFHFDWNIFGGEGNLQHQIINFANTNTEELLPRIQGLTK